MANNCANKDFIYQTSYQRHRRAASAASTLNRPSTDAALNAIPSLPDFDGHFNHPKSASSVVPREQIPAVDVRIQTAIFEDLLKENVQSPPLIDRPPGKKGITDSHDGSPITAAFHDDLLKSAPRGSQLEPPMQLLKLSKVQKLYEQEPIPSQQHTDDELLNQVTPAPQRHRLTNVSRAPRPTVIQVPKIITAFEYAMHPFLILTSTDDGKYLALSPEPSVPSQLSDSTTCSSFSLLSQDDGSMPLVSENGDSPESRSAAPIKKRSEFASRIQHVAIQTALVQCTMLQNTVQQLGRRPWDISVTHTARWHYVKICALAFRAIQLSQALESRGLQARSEYWAGRGCAGMRHYQAAEAHFRETIQLQKLSQDDGSGTLQPQGLLPTELENVAFLIESCRARLQNQKRRSDKTVEIAQQEATKGNKSLQDCLDEPSMISPPWMPDRDRMMELARRQFGETKTLSKISQPFVDPKQAWTLEFEVREQIKMESEELRIMTTKRLSEQEYEYIMHGERRQAEQPPRPATKLLDRREMELSPISTQSIRTLPHISNAARVSAPAESSVQDTKTVSVVPTKPKPPPIVASSSPLRRIPSFGTSNSRLDPVFEYNDDGHHDFDSEESDDEEEEQPKSAPIEQSKLSLAQLEISQASRPKLPQSVPATPLRSRSDTNLISLIKGQEMRKAMKRTSSRMAAGYFRSTHSPMRSGRSFHSPNGGAIMT
jgi:hypothetical protein